MYYQKSDAIILVFDITSIDSFNTLKKIYEEIKETINIQRVLFFVVGNKNDLYENELVKKEEAQNYAKSIKAEYMCVSALKPSGINELFECVGKKLCQKVKSEPTEDSLAISTSNIVVNENKKLKNKKKNCC